MTQVKFTETGSSIISFYDEEKDARKGFLLNY